MQNYGEIEDASFKEALLAVIYRYVVSPSPRDVLPYYDFDAVPHTLTTMPADFVEYAVRLLQPGRMLLEFCSCAESLESEYIYTAVLSSLRSTQVAIVTEAQTNELVASNTHLLRVGKGHLSLYMLQHQLHLTYQIMVKLLYVVATCFSVVRHITHHPSLFTWSTLSQPAASA